MKFSRRWLWLLLLVPLTLGLVRLRFDTDVLNLLPKDVPVVRGLQLYQENFSGGQELIITVQAPDAAAAETAARLMAEKLRRASNLVSRVTWQPPWIENRTAGADLIAYLWFNQPPALLGELTNRFLSENVSATLLEAREQLALSLSPNEIAMRAYDPFNLMTLPGVAGNSAFGNADDMFASSDGTFRVIYVEPAQTLGGYKECDDWLKRVQATVVEITREVREVHFGYTGRPAFVSQIAAGMQRDIGRSVTGTMLIIGVLFWLAHRRFRPLFWLLILLGLILATTLALGGVLFGPLNVVSLGFAAILLGLAVDYGLVLFQEAQANPSASSKDIRRLVGPSVIWSAITTAIAFSILNLSGLPGLGRLGSLVAIGTLIAAAFMLIAYLPPLEKLRLQRTTTPSTNRLLKALNAPWFVWGCTVAILIFGLVVLAKERPMFDSSSAALRPGNIPAYAAMEEIADRLGRKEEPLWIIVSGDNETQVAERLRKAENELSTAVAREGIAGFTLPNQLWPQPSHQQINKLIVPQLFAKEGELRSNALAHGFTTNSLALTERIFDAWRSMAVVEQSVWPQDEAGTWLLKKVAARKENELFALGLISPRLDPQAGNQSVSPVTRQFVENWPAEFERDGILLSGWPALSSAMVDIVRTDFPRVIVPMTMLLLFSLWLAFRSIREVALSIATLIVSALLLIVTMILADLSWNLMNMMAIPLLLGVGVDYSIHMQLALRRHQGDLAETRRTIGRALLLCSATTIAGFTSLAWASNAGIASLGKLCAIGIAGCLFTSTCLLPVWWRQVASRVSK